MSATPTTPPTAMVRLNINGRAVSVPKGTNVVQAAKSIGVHIPHYCYHEKLSVAGNCRMCLVELGIPQMTAERKPVLKADGTPEISWIPRPQIGCATPVTEGMAVRTDSKMVEECRKGVMEFLLINHPLDCPICDQAGECHLQEYSVQYGAGQSQFVEEKVHKPKKVQLGPRVTLDDERCILCSRCIRFCREVAKDDVLGFLQRGSHTMLACAPGRQLENNYSLNTVDLCPVGALTSTDFRFKMRVWFLKESESLCTSCSTGCNITVGAREGVVYRYTPRRNDAVNSEWMCDAGRLNYRWINDERRLQAVTHDSRVTRHDPAVEGHAATRAARLEANWESALKQCREALAAAKGKVAILASGRSSNEELFLLRKLAEACGARGSDIVPRQGKADGVLVRADRNPNTRGAQLMGLTGEIPGALLPKIREWIEKGEVEALLVVGECAVKAGLPEATLGRLKTLIAVDILPSRTTELAHWTLPGAAHVEKRGTMINGDGRIQRFQQAFPTKGQARAEWEIFRAFLPESAGFETFEGLFQKMTSEVPLFSGVTWNGLGSQGVKLDGGGAA